jgi:hypothetical protein
MRLAGDHEIRNMKKVNMKEVKMKLRTVLLLVIACVLPAESRAETKPLKVYILAGQSNMTGMAKTSTLEHIKMFPDTAKEFADIFDAEGNPVVLDDVYVSCWPKGDYTLKGKLKPGYGGGSAWTMIGPEYPFGIYMHKKLNEPILIIKTAQGGQDLFNNFRPPSAGEWTPPKGHPDLAPKPAPLALPKKLDLTADYAPPSSLVPEKPNRNTGKNMGIVGGVRGVPLGEMNGVHPIYLVSRAGREKDILGQPFQVGDLIIGVDGAGMGEKPIDQWREAWFGSMGQDGDWIITITRWRKGKIETFDVDIAELKAGGRENLQTYLAAQAKKASENTEGSKGYYYKMMIDHVKTVLKDVKKYHPGYDEKAGHDIAGFVWFQGYNDLVNKGAYPNRDKPRGYEQYTWLLEHFIRDVRKDLDAPELPFVIGVLGIGGVEDPPTSNTGYLQQAQAAPANNPEFKGAVAAVQAGKYWDHELVALAEKGDLQGKWLGDGWKNAVGANGKPLFKERPTYDEYRAQYLTAKEIETLSKAISDQGYHYFGSAKMMSGIGKGFAEAMIELSNGRLPK